MRKLYAFSQKYYHHFAAIILFHTFEMFVASLMVIPNGFTQTNGKQP